MLKLCDVPTVCSGYYKNTRPCAYVCWKMRLRHGNTFGSQYLTTVALFLGYLILQVLLNVVLRTNSGFLSAFCPKGGGKLGGSRACSPGKF